ncbi:hypothetical protein, partial [Massilia scottii]|uniref:hypothetical protein n=1 Tax=Massilia scottii TaxID=3057166 RepID=UPI002796D69A
LVTAFDRFKLFCEKVFPDCNQSRACCELPVSVIHKQAKLMKPFSTFTVLTASGAAPASYAAYCRQVKTAAAGGAR